MNFLRPEHVEQLAGSHPELADLLREFDSWSLQQGLPEATLIELWRSKLEQGQIYFDIWKKIAAQLRSGKPAEGPTQGFRPEMLKMSDAELRRLAEQRFTWHLVRCAADVRTRAYTRIQLLDIADWFTARCPKPMWELVIEQHGTGPHMHIGRRAFDWRKKFNPGDNNNGKISVA